MNYNIITDRFEIEKMAEDLFLSDDKQIGHIDYADIRTIKKLERLSRQLYVMWIYRMKIG